MDVSGIATPLTPNTSAEPKQSKLGKDEFLKLLMTQLGNQDPLSPMDNQAFVTQLAQFAQVEMAQQTSQQLDALLMAAASANQLQAASLVGKEALVTSGAIEWAGAPRSPKGTTPTVAITGDVGAGANNVTVSIVDAAGQVVRRMELGALPAGPVSATWDGLDQNGEVAPAGSYTVTIAAQDKNGKSVPAQAWSHSRITGVSFESGYAELVLANGSRVKLAEVLGVSESV